MSRAAPHDSASARKRHERYATSSRLRRHVEAAHYWLQNLWQACEEIIGRRSERVKQVKLQVSGLFRFSLCNLCVLCVSVVRFSFTNFLTTETQRTQRLHRENQTRALPILRIQLSYVPADGFSERFQVVAALETGNEPALTTTLRPLFQSPRHLDKIRVREQQLSQRIAEVRVETR